MRGFDRDHVSQDMVNRCIADLTLEKYTHARSADWYEKLAEVRQMNINAADNELKVTKEELAKADAELQATKEELVNIKKQLESANKKIESLKQYNDTLSTTVDILAAENRRLNEPNAVSGLKFHVSNIVMEHLPGYRKVRTTVCWGDHESTTVNLAIGDEMDPYNAFCAAVAKRVFGSNSQVKNIIERMTTVVSVDENGKAVLADD